MRLVLIAGNLIGLAGLILLLIQLSNLVLQGPFASWKNDLLMDSGMFLIGLSTLWLLSKGRVRWAARTLVFSLLVAVTIMIYFGGYAPFDVPDAVGLLMVVGLGMVLLDRGPAWLVAALAGASYTALSWLWWRGYLPPPEMGRSPQSQVQFSVLGWLMAGTVLALAIDSAMSALRTRTEALRRQFLELERVHEALRESEERFRVVMKSSAIVAAITDRDLRYVWIQNPHPDFRPDSIIGKRDDALTDGEGAKELMQLKRRVLEQGVGERTEITFALGDGSRTYDITAEPLRDTDGQVVGVITAAMDITERVEAEQELAAYQAELEAHRAELEARVDERTAELRKMVNLMAGREVRMAELKEVIARLRAQLEEAGLKPVADDPLLGERSQPIELGDKG